MIQHWSDFWIQGSVVILEIKSSGQELVRSYDISKILHVQVQISEVKLEFGLIKDAEMTNSYRRVYKSKNGLESNVSLPCLANTLKELEI